jgi:hypothetical protein
MTKLDKSQVIVAALVGVPDLGITVLFMDWYNGLKHLGLIFLLWFWLVPIFTV